MRYKTEVVRILEKDKTIMKQPKLTALFAVSLVTLAFAIPQTSVRAELVDEEVQEDSITPEEPAVETQVIVTKKKVAAKKPKALPQETVEPAYEPVMVQNQNVEVQQAAAQQVAPQSVGTALDQGVKTKMGEVQTQFENALLKTLDKIKITVDDGSMAPAPAPQQSQAVTTTIVQDSVVNAQGAPEAYMSLEDAPEIEEEDFENGTLAKAKIAEEVIENRVRISPLLGWTTINSDNYDVDSKYTAGLGIEVDVSQNLTAVASYSYSEYSVSMGAANPYYGYNPGLYGAPQTALQYNQNVFDAGLRFYLFPRRSVFNMFGGGGLGFNKGYLNYKSTPGYPYGYGNPYNNLDDYEVTSFLGTLETGAEISLGKSVALGMNFKWANVLSSKENQPINPYGFYGSNISPTQQMVGGSLAEDSFYSILGTVKVSF
jgi:hypothetical protein